MKRIRPFATLDALRGFAAIWVVMVHSVAPWIGSNHMAYLRSPLYAFSMRGQLGVVVFFVISGYCITAAAYSALVFREGVWKYALKRVRRIYPPYLAALALTVASGLLINFAVSHHLIGHVNHPATLPQSYVYWFANLTLLQAELGTGMANVVFWSLCYEISFYAIVGLFLWCALRVAQRYGPSRAVRLFASAICGSTLLSLAYLLVARQPIFPFDLWHQFSIGGLLFLLLELNPETTSAYSVELKRFLTVSSGAILLLVTLVGVYVPDKHTDVAHPSALARAIMCIGTFVVLIFVRRFDGLLSTSRIVRPLMYVGTFSYSLYLSHTVVLPFVDILCRRAGIDGQGYWMAILIQVAVAVLFGWMFFAVVERHFISKRQVRHFKDEHLAGLTSARSSSLTSA